MPVASDPMGGPGKRYWDSAPAYASNPAWAAVDMAKRRPIEPAWRGAAWRPASRAAVWPVFAVLIGMALLAEIVADDTPARPRGPGEHRGAEASPRSSRARKGDDILFGSARAEVLSGGDGNDLIVAGAGADVLIGDMGYDTLWGGGGDDTLIGDSAELSPEDGDDALAGGEDDDDLFGGAGNDVLVGGTGDDWLVGGAGDDTLTGGAGADVFAFGPHHGADTITDFMHGEDLIDLMEIAGVARFGDVRLRAVGGATVIDLARYGGGVIRLESTAVSDFGAGDFELYGPPANGAPIDGM